MYNNRVKNIEIPENLFSNLGEIKSRKIEEERRKSFKDNMKEAPEENSDIKFTTYEKKEEYRNRITKMYEGLKNIKPIDNQIDSEIYLGNYVEKGIVVKPKISSLKQFWTEYRLIKNEKEIPAQQIVEPLVDTSKKIDNFDALFDALSIRVKEINAYIDELKEMRNAINVESTELAIDKEKLTEDKKKFQEFKKQEEHKISKDKETLKINFERLQTIIDDLDKKLGSVED